MILSKKIETEIKNLPTNKSPRLHGEFYPIKQFRKDIIIISSNSSKKFKKKETIQTHFVNQVLLWQPKPDEKLNKILLKPIFLMNIGVKFFSKLLATESSNTLKGSYTLLK